MAVLCSGWLSSSDYYGAVSVPISVEHFYFLDQLASFRMETGLPAALRQDKKYQKAQKNCNKVNEKMQDLNLTPQQWDTVDAAITAENISSIEYIRIAYKQGIIDAFSILRETL